MIVEIGGESLLALRQAVDNRLTDESIEKLIDRKNDSQTTEQILQGLAEQGVIDELVGALRGLPVSPDARDLLL